MAVSLTNHDKLNNNVPTVAPSQKGGVKPEDITLQATLGTGLDINQPMQAAQKLAPLAAEVIAQQNQQKQFQEQQKQMQADREDAQKLFENKTGLSGTGAPRLNFDQPFLTPLAVAAIAIEKHNREKRERANYDHLLQQIMKETGLSEQFVHKLLDCGKTKMAGNQSLNLYTLLQNLAIKSNDIDRAMVIVKAYAELVRDTLSPDEQRMFVAWLVENVFFLGSKSFNHKIFFEEMGNQNPFKVNEAFKKAFDVFIDAIGFPPWRMAATAQKVKNIAILYPGGGGGGHMAPATAICNELKKLGHNVKLIDVDQVEAPYDPKIGGLTRALVYAEIYQKDQTPAKALALWAESSAKQKLVDRRFMSDLTEMLKDFNADHIFSVAHHLPDHAYLSYRLNIPMTYVHTDNEFRVDLISIACAQAVQHRSNKEFSPLIKFTVPKYTTNEFFKHVPGLRASPTVPPDLIAHQLEELDIPVRHSFHPVTAGEKRQIRQELHIPEEANVVKLAMGKNGIPKEIIGILNKLYEERLQATKPLHLVVVCGTNQALQKELDGYLAQHSFSASKLTVELKGFLDEGEMSKYDKASDVWITKLGGSTAAEAGEMHKQVLHVAEPNHPWEFQNARLLEEMGFAQALQKEGIIKQVESRAPLADLAPKIPRENWKEQMKQILIDRRTNPN